MFINDRQKINRQKVKHQRNESATQQLIFIGYNYSSLAETFEFSWSLFAEEHNALPQSIRRNKHLEPHRHGYQISYAQL